MENYSYLRSGLLNESDMKQEFKPTRVINPGRPLTVPETGHVGYVKIENPYEYIGLCNPQWGDVDLRTGEIVR